MFLKNKKNSLLTILFLMIISFSVLAKPIGVYKDISNSKWKDTPMSVRKVLINLNMLNSNVNIFEVQWLKEIKTRYELYGLSKSDLDWVNSVLQKNSKTWTPRNDYAPIKKSASTKEVLKSDDSNLIHETEDEKKNAPVDVFGNKKEKKAITSGGIALVPNSKEMKQQNDNLDKNVAPVKIFTGEDLSKSVALAKKNRGKNNYKELKNTTQNTTKTNVNITQENIKTDKQENINKIENSIEHIIDPNMLENRMTNSYDNFGGMNKFNFDFYNYTKYLAWIILNGKTQNDLYRSNIEFNYDYYVKSYDLLKTEQEIKKEKILLEQRELENNKKLAKLNIENSQKTSKELKIQNNEQHYNTREVILILTLICFLFIGIYIRKRGKNVF